MAVFGNTRRASTGVRGVFVGLAVGITLVVACGGSNGGTGPAGDAGDDGGSNGSSGASGGGTTTSSGASGSSSGASSGGDMFGAPSDAGFSLDALSGCAASTSRGTELPLDLYFMLDSSGSMDDLVAQGASKWSQVVSAISAFVDDSASAGVGVGLQYFPLDAAGVPASCTADSQCPAGTGPCFFKACDLSLQEVIPCSSNADCIVQGHQFQCENIGVCHNDVDVVCPIMPGAIVDCGNDTNGFALGTCDSITSSTCTLGDSCTAQDYQTPAVPIALLPGAAAAVKTSLAGHSPNGNTPTSQALLGAIDQAKAYATANPGHAAVAVLATDGIPDECTPADTAGIAQIAAAGLSGSPSVKTFVIGVFTPNDITAGTSTLNTIAAAGGTNQAFIISTANAATTSVETQFQSALNSIRSAALPCQYMVPLPDSGVPDYLSVNVAYTPSSGASVGLPYVESESKCGTGSGWYYDVDPATGATPSAINVCPSTCSTVQGDTGGRVDVVVGCATMTR